MRTLHVIVYLMAFFVAIPGAYARHMPDPADHEFNNKVPSNFKGRDQMLGQGSQSFKVYVTGPEQASNGILLIHEWWGLNDHIRSWADRFAAMGYRAVAIDLYDGKITRDPDQAGKLMKAVDQAVANRKLKAAIGWLKRPGRRLATIGWCFGGGQSLQASLQAPQDIAATIIYYGKPVLDVERLKTLQGPVLGLYAKQDGWITPAVVSDFQQAMNKAGKPFEMHMYDAKHAFANPSGKRYDSEAARASWKVVRAFLHRVMNHK